MNSVVTEYLKNSSNRRNKINNISEKINRNESLTDDEKNIWIEYTEKQKESLKLSSEYLKQVKKPKKQKKFEPSYELFTNLFLEYYKKNEKVDFKITSTTKVNVKTLLMYFTKDKRFFKSPILKPVISFNGTKKTSKPSFEKGLLIVGGFGTSKTSSIKTIKSIFNEAYRNGLKADSNFKYYTVKTVVQMFETCKDEVSLDLFWQNMESGDILFDDLKSESIANRYGKKDVLREVLEKRNDKKLKTHLLINYNPKHNGDLSQALMEIGELYGGRLFDRLFMDYNILEFKGKSMRGLV